MPESASSADSFDEGVHLKSITKLRQLEIKPDEAALQQQAYRVHELHLTFRMKQEELKSLQRLSEQFLQYKHYLDNEICRRKAQVGEDIEPGEVLEGFKDEVEWEDSKELDPSPDA